eukprot:TRINITY_DN26004_c0_g1_i2.p2 TRINITY_DN26004_c0_g1~~TRINITY_DN26004_c0_g1_i2.p2  ORF type:complete len:373 (+),score=65.68 TRINITY_DN26004_c0_g1_i2:3-1121(+)
MFDWKKFNGPLASIAPKQAKVSSLALPKSVYRATALNQQPLAASTVRVAAASPSVSGLSNVPRVGARSAGGIELYTPEFFMYCGIGGILSCGLTHMAVTPLDVVKCRMQVQPGIYANTVAGLRSVGATEGLRGLYTGWTPTLVGYSFQGLCKFGFYEFFKWYYGKLVGEKTAYEQRSLLYSAASASAEFIADVALCPFEAVKVKIQTNDGWARGMSDGFPKFIREEGGVGALYKGLVPLWARQVPYTVVKFVAFERIVEAIYKSLPKEKHEYGKGGQLLVTFAGGYLAGIFCAIVSQPADNIVSILNKGGPGVTMGSVVSQMGLAGAYRGLAPRIVMIGTLTGLQWFIYDSFKTVVGLPTSGGAPPPKDAEK